MSSSALVLLLVVALAAALSLSVAAEAAGADEVVKNAAQAEGNAAPAEQQEQQQATGSGGDDKEKKEENGARTLKPEEVPEDLRQWAEMAKKFKDEPMPKADEVPWDLAWDYAAEGFKRCKQAVPEDQGKYTKPEHQAFRGICAEFEDIVQDTFDEQGGTLQQAFENQHSTAVQVASKQAYHYLGARMMDKHINWMATWLRSGRRLDPKRNSDEFIQRFFKFFAEVMKEVDNPGSGNVFTPDSTFDMPDVDKMRAEYLEAHPEEAPQVPPEWEPKKEALKKKRKSA